MIENVIKVGQRRLQSNVAPNDFLTEDTKDKPRGKNLVRMKIVNRCTDALQIEGVVVTPGAHEIAVFEDRVHVVEALVEHDQRALDQAREQYVREVVDLAREGSGFPGTTQELTALIVDGKADPDVMDELRRVQEERTFSVESIFEKTHKRGIKPLDSAEVIKGSEHREPKRVLQEKERDAMTEAIGRGLAAALKDLGLITKPKN